MLASISISVGVPESQKDQLGNRCQLQHFPRQNHGSVANQCSHSLRIRASLVGGSRTCSTSQHSRLRIGQSCNGIDRAIARLKVVGDLGAGASGAGLNAAFGRRDEAVAGTSVRTICKALEVCVVSGGRGLLEAASAVIIAFDLDVPFG